MQNDNRAGLDEKSLQILFVLSGHQTLSIEEIARSVDMALDKGQNNLRYLENRRLVHSEKGKYKITPRGMTYVIEKDIQRPRQVKPPKPSQPDGVMSLPLFGSWQDLIFWLVLTIISFILFMGLGLLAAKSIKNEIIYIAIFVIFGIFWLIFIILSIKRSYHSVPEYERLVVFRLGKCVGAKGPGPILNLPYDRIKTVDVRLKHQEVPHEACITQDNVQIDVDFVFYWKIQQPVWSITRVTDPEESIKLLATALLRAVIAHFPFMDVLNKRESINDRLKEKIDEISSEWGVYVPTVEIREIKPPEEIVKSMHKQREAEWNKQATVTNAEAQAQALKLLYEIANSIDDKTLSIKYFEMLKDLGQGESTKYIFPLELTNLVNPLLQRLKARKEANSSNWNEAALEEELERDDLSPENIPGGKKPSVEDLPNWINSQPAANPMENSQPPESKPKEKAPSIEDTPEWIKPLPSEGKPKKS
jgi:hypothetical protein